jgi:hypothetical protein
MASLQASHQIAGVVKQFELLAHDLPLGDVPRPAGDRGILAFEFYPLWRRYAKKYLARLSPGNE